MNRGTVRYYLKEYEASENDLRKAIKLDENEANAYNALALLAIDLNEYEKALSLVNKALVLETNQPYFLNNRGFIYLQMNKIQEAEKDINSSIVLDPTNGWAYRNKGLLYMKEGNSKGAIVAMQRGIDLDDFIDNIYYYMGNAHSASGEEVKACDAWKESVKRGEKGKDMLEQHCN